MENNEQMNQEEVFQEPAKVEKITSLDIEKEMQRQKDEETDELVRRIMNKILEIK